MEKLTIKGKLLVEIVQFESKISELMIRSRLNKKEMCEVKNKMLKLKEELASLENKKEIFLHRYDKAIATLVTLVASILIPNLLYEFVALIGANIMIESSAILKYTYGFILLVGTGSILVCCPKIFGMISNKLIQICSKTITNSPEYDRQCKKIIYREFEIQQLNEDIKRLQQDYLDIEFERSKNYASLKIKKWLLENIGNGIDINNVSDRADEDVKYPSRRRVKIKSEQK